MADELKRRLAESVIRSRPDQAARILERRPPSACARTIEALPPLQRVELLRAMVPSVGGQVLAALQDDTAKDALLRMPARTAALLLRRTPEEKSSALLGALPDRRRRAIEALVRQRQKTAGALADPDVLVLNPVLTAGEVLTQFRVELIHATHELPVVDEEGGLVGLVDPRRLTSAPKTQAVEEIMTRRFERLPARMLLRSLASHAGWQTRSSLPVVEANGAFVGMLSREASGAALAQAAGGGPERPMSSSEALGEVFVLGIGGIVGALFQPFGRK